MRLGSRPARPRHRRLQDAVGFLREPASRVSESREEVVTTVKPQEGKTGGRGAWKGDPDGPGGERPPSRCLHDSTGWPGHDGVAGRDGVAGDGEVIRTVSN